MKIGVKWVLRNKFQYFMYMLIILMLCVFIDMSDFKINLDGEKCQKIEMRIIK